MRGWRDCAIHFIEYNNDPIKLNIASKQTVPLLSLPDFLIRFIALVAMRKHLRR